MELIGGAFPVVHEEVSSPVSGRPSVSISTADMQPMVRNGRNGKNERMASEEGNE